MNEVHYILHYSFLGGVWAYSDEVREGQGAGIYASLITNVSKELSCFSDFPFPPDQTPYMTGPEMHTYIMEYASQFHLLHYIQYNTKILKVRCEFENLFLCVSTIVKAPSFTIYLNVSLHC